MEGQVFSVEPLLRGLLVGWFSGPQVAFQPLAEPPPPPPPPSPHTPFSVWSFSHPSALDCTPLNVRSLYSAKRPLLIDCSSLSNESEFWEEFFLNLRTLEVVYTVAPSVKNILSSSSSSVRNSSKSHICLKFS